MSVLFYIPAKSHSSRLPGKNFKKLFGRPLYQHSVDFALLCSEYLAWMGVHSTVVVDTDVPEAISVNGVKVFKRSNGLTLKKDATIADCLRAYIKKEWKLMDDDDLVVVLQPTTPFRNLSDVVGAIRSNINGGLASAHEVPTPVFEKVGRVCSMETGSFFVVGKGFLENNRKISGADSLRPADDSIFFQDINTLDDWERVEREYIAQIAREGVIA